MISSVANFDIMPTDEIFDYFFTSDNINNSTVLNINFEQAGYQTGNVIRNIKSFFIYIAGLILLTIIYQISKRLKNRFKL